LLWLAVTEAHVRPRSRLFSAFFLALFTAALWPGCAHEDDVAPGLADVLFEGSASDEAWLAIDEAPVTEDPAGASWTFTPTRWSRAGTAPTFTWSSSLSGVRHRRAPHGLPPDGDASPGIRLARGFDALLVPVAHAHLPPITGQVYRLIFTIPGEGAPLRVLTTDPSFTPGAAALTSLNRATGPVALELVHTYLVGNRVMEGPYRLPPIALTVE
jgi:hypothetical protein